MIRFVFSLFFSVVLARWAYSEIKLGYPEFVPYIDYALERVQIPTHDHWPVEKFKSVAAAALKQLETQEAVAQEQKHPSSNPSFNIFNDSAAETF